MSSNKINAHENNSKLIKKSVKVENAHMIPPSFLPQGPGRKINASAGLKSAASGWNTKSSEMQNRNARGFINHGGIRATLPVNATNATSATTRAEDANTKQGPSLRHMFDFSDSLRERAPLPPLGARQKPSAKFQSPSVLNPPFKLRGSSCALGNHNMEVDFDSEFPPLIAPVQQQVRVPNTRVEQNVRARPVTLGNSSDQVQEPAALRVRRLGAPIVAAPPQVLEPATAAPAPMVGPAAPASKVVPNERALGALGVPSALSSESKCLGCQGPGRWRACTQTFVCNECREKHPHQIVTRSRAMSEFKISYPELTKAVQDKTLEEFWMHNYRSPRYPIHFYYRHQLESCARRKAQSSGDVLQAKVGTTKTEQVSNYVEPGRKPDRSDASANEPEFERPGYRSIMI